MEVERNSKDCGMMIAEVFNDFVLVELVEADKMTKSGLIIPENVKSRYSKGRVFVTKDNLYAGDIVLFLTKFGFDESPDLIEVGDKKLLVLKKEQIVLSFAGRE